MISAARVFVIVLQIQMNVAVEKGLSDSEEEFVDETNSSQRCGIVVFGVMWDVVENVSKDFGRKRGEGSGRKGRKRN